MFDQIVDFIRGIYGNADYIPLHEPRFRGNEKKYLEECIDSTFVSSVGKFVNEFEERIREFTGAARAVACVNGTEALNLALKLAGVQPGDEVITQPLTFIATANAIAYNSAYPVFVDVDRETLGLSPDSLKVFLEEFGETKDGKCFNKKTGRRIAACVPMHSFGHPVRLAEIMDLCSRYGIPLVEDAAESLGSTYHGRHTGTFGKLGILSFNGNKTLTTGGGGMIITNDEALGRLAKHLTTQAKVPHPWEFYHDNIGYNYRLPNLNAALGVAQMEQLPGFIENKRQLAERYQEFFSKMGIPFVKEPEGCRSNYWLNAILFKSKKERDTFLEYSNTRGVGTRPAWTLMNKLPMYSRMQSADLTNANWLEERLVNIPSSVVI